MARTSAQNPSSATSANKKSTSTNKKSSKHKARSSRSTGHGKGKQPIDGEDVSVLVRAVAEAPIDEPEAVIKRVTKQTAQCEGKRHTPQSSDDEELVARSVKHPWSAKNACTNESSRSQQTHVTKTTSLPQSTHSMACRSKLVNGNFFT